MAKPVKSKKDFVKRFLANEFGNRGPNWETYEEWKEHQIVNSREYKPTESVEFELPMYHVRSKTPGGPTFYNLRSWHVKSTIDNHQRDLKDGYYLAEMAPHEYNLIQGEVCRTHRGLELYFSRVKDVPMRMALSTRSETRMGLRADHTLRTYLCPNSYEWLMYLLDEYDGHTIEFSTFSRNWGTLPGYNTVFWEIRLY